MPSPEPLQELEQHPHDKVKNHHPPRPYWRRAHTDWKFWVAVFFLFAALLIYIFSFDLVLIPRN
jgi:hypothetical protein